MLVWRNKHVWRSKVNTSEAAVVNMFDFSKIPLTELFHYFDIISILFIVIWIVSGVIQFKRRGRKTLLILLLLFGCWFFYCRYEWMKPPPSYVDSLAEFTQNADTSQYHLESFMIHNLYYFELVGPLTSLMKLKILFTLGSGYPGYVFNQEGYLIDWTYDRDDDSRYSDKWITSVDRTRKTSMTFEAALELIETLAENQSHE